MLRVALAKNVTIRTFYVLLFLIFEYSVASMGVLSKKPVINHCVTFKKFSIKTMVN